MHPDLTYRLDHVHYELSLEELEHLHLRLDISEDATILTQPIIKKQKPGKGRR